MSDRVMRLPEVVKLTSLHRATIYRLMTARLFPAQKKIPGVRAASWAAVDVEAYLAKQREQGGMSGDESAHTGKKAATV
ncbi:hypothetical protein BZM27_09265 [Paraburkholderia steynii]|uniref:Uncharacterized protein n=1 Tax=Paraburkholderia steynii TaxID=1245441 RepID=A0A4R0XN96_9BURK|nr:hypothetical protein BZM27_09265 [Paraburkholderia steynii]